MTAGELAVRLNVLVRTAQLHLQLLNRYGLVRRGTDHRWHRTERSFDEVAREIGVAGQGTRQCQRHDEEREKHRRYLFFRFGIVPPSGKPGRPDTFIEFPNIEHLERDSC